MFISKLIRKPLFFIILLIPTFNYLNAKIIYTHHEQEEEEFRILQCSSRFIGDPIYKMIYGARFFFENIEFYIELSNLCTCLDKVSLKQQRIFKKQNFAYYFQDRSEYFGDVDLCLRNDLLWRDGHFSILIRDALRPIIDSRINSYFQFSGRSLSSFVNEQIIKKDIGCLEEKIGKACLGRDSIYLSYRCLQETFKNSQKMMNYYKDCFSHQNWSEESLRI